MRVKEELRNYKETVGYLINYDDNIRYYEECLADGEKLIEYINRPGYEVKNIQKYRNITAPQDMEIIKKEIGIKQVKEELQFFKGRRNDLFSKLYILDQCLIFLKNISPEEEFIVECKMVDKMGWNDIDISFNKKFRNNEKTIGYNMLVKKLSLGLNKMQKFADSFPFYKIDYLSDLKILKIEYSFNED